MTSKKAPILCFSFFAVLSVSRRLQSMELLGVPRSWQPGARELQQVLRVIVPGLLAFSPDGTTVITAQGNKFYLWDVKTGRSIEGFAGEKTIKSLIVNPDGTTFFTHDGEKVLIWDAKTGRKLRECAIGSITSMVLSPNGTTMLIGVAMMLQQMVCRFDINTGCLSQYGALALKSSFFSMGFSPDGKTACITESNNVMLQSFSNSLKTKEINGTIYSATFSPDGDTILLVSTGETGLLCSSVCLWDITKDTLLVLRKDEETKYDTRFAGFSPDGNTIVTIDGPARYGSNECKAFLWNAKTAELLHTFGGEKSEKLYHPVQVAAFSPDSRTILTGSFGNSLGEESFYPDTRLWDVKTGQLLQVFRGHPQGVRFVAFSPDGTTVLTGDTTLLHLWGIKKDTEQLALPSESNLSYRVTCSNNIFSENGTIDAQKGRIYGCSLTKTTALIQGSTEVHPNNALFFLCNTKTGKQLQVLQEHVGDVTSATLSPDGTTVLMTRYSDKVAYLWDITTGHLEKLEGHTHTVTKGIYSPDGKIVLTASGDIPYPTGSGGDATARLWDAKTGQQLLLLQGHTSPICSVAYSPDGTTVLTGSHDKTIRLWDVKTGQQLHILKGHEDAVTLVAYSPDGETVLTGSNDNTVCLYDVKTGQQLHVLKHEGSIVLVLWSPDGKTFLTQYGDKSKLYTIYLWDRKTGRQLHKLRTESIMSLDRAVYSSDGKTILTGSWDGVARLWDVETGHQLQTMKHEGNIYLVAFSPDDNTILIGLYDGTICFWSRL